MTASSPDRGQRRHDVFVSYAHADSARVEPLVRLLRSRGLAVFWDPHLPAAGEYPHHLEAAMDSSAAVVVCWSAASVTRPWVREEAYRARAQRKLVPVALEPVNPPLGLALLQSVDLSGWDGRTMTLPVTRLEGLIVRLAGRGRAAPTIDTTWSDDPLALQPPNTRLTVQGVVASEPSWHPGGGRRGSRAVIDLLVPGGHARCVAWGLDPDDLPARGHELTATGRVNEWQGRHELSVKARDLNRVRRTPVDAGTAAQRLYAHYGRCLRVSDHGSWRCDPGKATDAHVLTSGQETLVSAGGEGVQEIPDDPGAHRFLLAQELDDPRGERLMLGYPVYCHPLEPGAGSHRGPSRGSSVEPFLALPVTLLRSPRIPGFLVLEIGEPVAVNTSIDLPGVTELQRGEAVHAWQDSGDVEPGERLRVLLRDLGIPLEPDPTRLGPLRPGHACNSAVLFRPGAGPRTANRIRDLDDLATDGADGPGPLDLLVHGDAHRRWAGRLTAHRNLSPTSIAQDIACARALTQPLTVVTGPPGTGKSALISNLVAAARSAGLTIAVASSNNQAVDSVAEKTTLATDGDDPVRLAMRAGSTQLDPALRTAVAATMRWADRSAPSRDALTEARLAWTGVLHSLAASYDDADRRLGLERLHEACRVHLDDVDHDLPEAVAAAVRQPGDGGLRTACDQLARRDRGRVDRRGRLPRKPAGWWVLRPVRRELRRSLRRGPGHGGVGRRDVARGAAVIRLRALSDHLNERLRDIPGWNDLDDTMADDGRARHRREAGRHLCGIELAHGLARAPAPARAAVLDWLTRSGDASLPPRKLVADAVGVLPAWLSTLASVRRVLPPRRSGAESVAAGRSGGAHRRGPRVSGPPVVDIAVVDEASQCAFSDAVPLLARARRAVVVGDPHQLRHVPRLADPAIELVAGRFGVDLNVTPGFDEDLYTVAARAVGDDVVLLDRHYRCHPDIVGFSNARYYGGRIAVRTDTSGWADDGGPVVRWHDCRAPRRPADRRANGHEATSCLALVRRYACEGMSVGVITPYRSQLDLVRRTLSADGIRVGGGQDGGYHVAVGTVDAFQGSECDIVILSLVLGESSGRRQREFVGSDHRVNVAVTRARRRLDVVGDRVFWSRGNDAVSALLAHCDRLADRHGHPVGGHGKDTT
ncbi:MAG: AAA domain-containing protein [Actinomycetales bacterium]